MIDPFGTPVDCEGRDEGASFRNSDNKYSMLDYLVEKSKFIVSSLVVIMFVALNATAQITTGFYHPIEGSVVTYDTWEPAHFPIRGDLELYLDVSNGIAQILSDSLELKWYNEPFTSFSLPCAPTLTELDGTIVNLNTLTFVGAGNVELVFTTSGGDQLLLNGWMSSACPDIDGFLFESIVLSPGRRQLPAIPTLGWFGTGIFVLALAVIGAARLR